MNPEIVGQLYGLGIIFIISLLIWLFYRRRTFTSDDKYLTFGPRFWTGTVDSLVLYPIAFLSTVLFTFNLPRPVAAIILVSETIAWVVYTAVMHARYGQTVGKMVTKVRVVDHKTESSITWKQAWLRESIPALVTLGFLGYQVAQILTGHLTTKDLAKAKGPEDTLSSILLYIPSLWFLAELLTMLTNKRRRALHDFIAGTVVIRTNLAPDESLQDAAPIPGRTAEPA